MWSKTENSELLPNDYRAPQDVIMHLCIDSGKLGTQMGT